MRGKVENFKLSQLNGYTLFFPKSVIRDNKIVQKTISKHLLCDWLYIVIRFYGCYCLLNEFIYKR